MIQEFLNSEGVLPIVMTFTFWGLLIIFIALSIILNYHWRKYGVTKLSAFKFKIIYYAVAIFLLGLMVFVQLNYF